ncbi:formate/nitrite transporter family protein [Prosthecomicrobium sp. N25]|uniref:formate/nitrite transporter family protein n=1 Tax=Prosthecomicrobium sp. N25 TaxID=3129254 RepID=UPI0030787859
MAGERERLHHEPHLSEGEAQAIEDRLMLRPVAVYEVVRQEGEEELARPASSLWWSGIAAGISIGFSLVAEGVLHGMLPDAPWRHLVESWGYTVGFLIVILGRQQLFTESTLTAVLPALADPSRAHATGLARVWGIVLAANMVGTAVFAAGLAWGRFVPAEFDAGILAVARHLMEAGSADFFFRAIVSGWLIATVVWLIPSSESAAFFVIAAITYLIALLGVTHVVAGAVDVFYLVFLGEISAGHALFGFFLPTLLGNIVGGSALFALVAYAQVREEMATEPRAGPKHCPSEHRPSAGDEREHVE